MKYKVTIIGHIDVEADSKEEAEVNAMNEFDDRCSVSLDKFGLSPHEQLQFHAFETLTPEEVFGKSNEEMDSLDTKL
jgi:hypothetical protein